MTRGSLILSWLLSWGILWILWIWLTYWRRTILFISSTCCPRFIVSSWLISSHLRVISNLSSCWIRIISISQNLVLVNILLKVELWESWELLLVLILPTINSILLKRVIYTRALISTFYWGSSWVSIWRILQAILTVIKSEIGDILFIC